jgi:uncharacterized protein YdhG (YjbR/CyaY superfamily)
MTRRIFAEDCGAAYKKWTWTGLKRVCSIVRMKTKSPVKSGTAARAGTAAKTIGDYISGVPEPARGVLARMRVLIRSALPSETVETISYGMPAFKSKKVLVWFGGFKNHCRLFPTATVVAEFRDELEGFAVSKGTVRFPLDKPLPASLIKKMVKARREQSEGGRRKL